MLSNQSIGAIKVPRMIWTATFLSLGSLFVCWNNCEKDNPSIMDTAMQYPYTIIFRVGLMYSLFIIFLQNLFIKWWLDSSQISKHTKKILFFSIISLISYGLFVSTIDRKRINYQLAEEAVFVSSITNFLAIFLIIKNIKQIREQQPYFIGFLSWKMKKIMSWFFFLSMTFGLFIYLGFVDIAYKNKTQYSIVISSYLFYSTFVLDFRKFSMDIQKLSQQTRNVS